MCSNVCVCGNGTILADFHIIIGGTVYPGLMITAAMLHWLLHMLNISVNIRNVCVFLAPIFSAYAALASYLLTTEVTKKSATGLLAAAFTAIVPSYISRYITVYIVLRQCLLHVIDNEYTTKLSSSDSTVIREVQQAVNICLKGTILCIQPMHITLLFVV